MEWFVVRQLLNRMKSAEMLCWSFILDVISTALMLVIVSLYYH